MKFTAKISVPTTVRLARILGAEMLQGKRFYGASRCSKKNSSISIGEELGVEFVFVPWGDNTAKIGLRTVETFMVSIGGTTPLRGILSREWTRS